MFELDLLHDQDEDESGERERRPRPAGERGGWRGERSWSGREDARGGGRRRDCDRVYSKHTLMSVQNDGYQE